MSNSSRFKGGDRVFYKYKNYSGLFKLNYMEIINRRFAWNVTHIKHFSGEKSSSSGYWYEEYMVLEKIWNSPLYQLMQETEE